mgnify:CR=1 FL=1
MEVIENIIGVVLLIFTGVFAYGSAVMVDNKNKFIKKYGRAAYIKGTSKRSKKTCK